jgi:hypothetical protein
MRMDVSGRRTGARQLLAGYVPAGAARNLKRSSRS